MEVVGNFALYIWEFTTRVDFLGVYLLLIALTCVTFGMRSLLQAEARGFGWDGSWVSSETAINVGKVWLLVGGLMFLAGALLVSTT